MTPEMIAVRQRLYDDFAFYASHALKIRTKSAQVVPFSMNEAQRRLHAVVEEQYARTGKVRIIILKARQMGLSTWVGGRLFSRVSQRPAKKALVVTHHADSTRALFDMTSRFYDLLPDMLKLPTKYASRRELRWGGMLDSGYIVGTAGADTLARGETITHAHLSEVAFWPKSKAQELFSGMMDSIPNRPDTEVYIESTANGVSGIFYDQWNKALKGQTDFIPVFLPWFVEPEYRAPAPADFQRTPDEESIADLHGLDNDQLQFRRVKIAEKGRDLFMQEYPSTADEAFLTSGRPVFDGFLLRPMKAHAPAPIAQLALEGGDLTNGGWKKATWEPHSRGELLVYRKLDREESYFIGADVAQGGAHKDADFSVACVMDSDRRQVAVWRGQVDPDYFAYVLGSLGRRYNNALLIVENNNHGAGTITTLSRYMTYPNLFQEVIVDKVTDKETTRLGFNTNVKSKPLIVDKLRACLRKGEVDVVDKMTLDELTTYIITESGKMEADSGSHDDTVIALCLANHVVERRWAPVENVDEYFVTFEE